MLSEIIQLIQAWARRLWRRITHSNRDERSPKPPSASQGPAREPPEVPSPATPVHPVDQPTSSGESAELTGATDRDQYPSIPTDIEPTTPSSDRSEETLFDPPEGTSQKTDSPSTQPTEDREHAQSSANSSTDSGEGSTNAQQCEDAKPKAPRLIGGKRHSHQPPTQQPKDDAEAKLQFTPRPELICRQDLGSWQWEVVLSADDECHIAEVRHDDDKPIGMLNGECRLSSLTGSLSIALEGGERREFKLFDGTPMVFKSRNNWAGNGRKVHAITSGFYVVIAPNEWKRTGRVPVEPASCTGAGFTAHYFFQDRNDSTEDLGGFQECQVVSISSGFELVGKRIFDDSGDGELFVGAIPVLKPSQDVVWARIGEEETSGWKGENFKPKERTLANVLNGRQGRFFIRVYDETRLLDSGEFRYLRDLEGIRVNGERYTTQKLLIPPSTGHPPTKVHFIGVDDAAVRPILPPELTHVDVRGSDLVVEPHPSGDYISCVLESDTGRVDIVLNLPRIWWRMKRDEGTSGEWRDMPLAMTRREFREHARANATMQLRLPPPIKSVRVGFDGELARVYRPAKEENDRSIPLADFVDYSQIDRRLNDDASFNVECGGAVLTLIRISADPVPAIISFTHEPGTVGTGEHATLRWKTRNAEAEGVVIDPEIGLVQSSGCLKVAPLKTTTYTLRLTAPGMDDVTKAVTVTVRPSPQSGGKPIALVRRAGGGWRHGKGFSHSELRAASLVVADALRWSMPIDKRRRTTHPANIETIRRSIDA